MHVGKWGGSRVACSTAELALPAVGTYDGVGHHSVWRHAAPDPLPSMVGCQRQEVRRSRRTGVALVAGSRESCAEGAFNCLVRCLGSGKAVHAPAEANPSGVAMSAVGEASLGLTTSATSPPVGRRWALSSAKTSFALDIARGLLTSNSRPFVSHRRRGVGGLLR